MSNEKKLIHEGISFHNHITVYASEEFYEVNVLKDIFKKHINFFVNIYYKII